MDTLPPPLPPGRAPRNVVARGWLLIVCGLFLSVGMSYLTWYMLGVVNAPTTPGGSTRWHGSHETTVRMFWLFGSVLVFGVLSLLNGLWCVRRRAFQPVLRALMLLAAAALVVAGVLLSNTFKS